VTAWGAPTSRNPGRSGTTSKEPPQATEDPERKLMSENSSSVRSSSARRATSFGQSRPPCPRARSAPAQGGSGEPDPACCRRRGRRRLTVARDKRGIASVTAFQRWRHRYQPTRRADGASTSKPARGRTSRARSTVKARPADSSPAHADVNGSGGGQAHEPSEDHGVLLPAGSALVNGTDSADSSEVGDAVAEGAAAVLASSGSAGAGESQLRSPVRALLRASPGLVSSRRTWRRRRFRY